MTFATGMEILQFIRLAPLQSSRRQLGTHPSKVQTVYHLAGFGPNGSYQPAFTSTIVRFSDEKETPSFRTVLPEKSYFSA